jgi:hypothetical protein
LAAASFVLWVSACDSWDAEKSVTTPSDDPTLRASILAPVVPVNVTPDLVEPTRAFQCSSGLDFTGPVDIAMTAGQNVDLHDVTITLVSNNQGSSNTFVQPPTNTFSDSDLAAAFGTTLIPGGTTKTLTFHTRLSCGLQAPESIAADIRFLEASGRRNSVTVSAPFASFVRVTN